MNVTLIGIDLAKSVFQVCAVNQAGKPVFNRQVKRQRLLALLLEYPKAIVAMEACSGSNYWGRTLQRHGMDVRLIPPQHVKPFVKGNKNDRNDAFAITEAAQRPHLRCVLPRTLTQTDLIQAHRVRERQVNQRTALTNQIRGLLNEYGIVLPQGRRRLQSALPGLLENADNELTPEARVLLEELLIEWHQRDAAINRLDRRIDRQAKGSDAAQRLMTVKGIAEKTATALVAHAGDGRAYRNGRELAANLGLVPREHSSGGKQNLGGLTRRGNTYLRRMLIQGAWSVLRNAHRNHDRLSCWARQVAERRGKHKAVGAIANKMARISWALMYYQQSYRSA